MRACVCVHVCACVRACVCVCGKLDDDWKVIAALNMHALSFSLLFFDL